MAAFWHRNDSLSLATYLVESYDAGNNSKGVKMLERLAERGNVEAQLKLGEVLRWGKPPAVDPSDDMTIKPNIPAAIKWLKRAADQGDKRGYDGLWRIYGHKGNVDEEKILHYLLIAAQKGAANAQSFLGRCYMEGSILPVPQNYSEGVKWLRKAARSGHNIAQEELAKAYRDGTGVNVDLIKSYIWFAISARAEAENERKVSDLLKEVASNHTPHRKGKVQIERDGVAARLTTSQLIEAQNVVDNKYYIANNYEDLD
jgi:TPR repeat protein